MITPPPGFLEFSDRIGSGNLTGVQAVERVPSAVTQKHPEQQVGRYAIFDQIAAGGMARVHLARLAGQEGFSRVVAVKRMHRHLLENTEFKRMFLEEALLAARVRHPNVVPILDVIATGDELVIVMEYVHGVSIHALMLASVQARANMPRPIVRSMLTQTLHGLHAAHEARDEKGVVMGLVHRDVSPQNVLVGVDGIARVLDFGVARAVGAKQDTDPGVLKGKHSYMAPELIGGGTATRQSDVFSAATLLWELLAGRKLFGGANEQERLNALSRGNYESPRKYVRDIAPALERIVMRGIAPEPEGRYATALEMAVELEALPSHAPPRVVGEWVAKLGHEDLTRRVELIQQIETSSVNVVRTSVPPELVDPQLVPVTIAESNVPVAKPPELARASGSLRFVVFAVVGVVLIGLIAWFRSSSELEGKNQAAGAPTLAPETPAQSADAAAVPAPPPPGSALSEPASEPLEPSPDETAAPAASPAQVNATPGQAAPERARRAPPKPKEFLPNEL
jgi:serine/threonine-protein kinase